MAKAWSISTTVRNPDRMKNFLEIASKLDGQPWDNANQCKFQILLTQARLYGFGNTQFYNGLTSEQINIMEDLSRDITYEEAKQILDTKNYEGGPAMRGRQSLNPLKKIGLVFVDSNKILRISNLGMAYMNSGEDLGKILFKSFLKLQYPNPDNRDFTGKNGFNIKPFIGVLHLINIVNKKWTNLGYEAKGLSKFEFALFTHTLINYNDIGKYADKIIALRNQLIGKSKDDQEKFKDKYIRDYVTDFFKLTNKESINRQIIDLYNYGDNTLRYFRMTRFICLRGGGYYIDLEPRRSVEIHKILELYDGSADSFNDKQQYIQYLSDYNEPPLPWENIDELHKIISSLVIDINSYRNTLQGEEIRNNFSEENYQNYTIKELNRYIDKLRLFRTGLQEKIEYKSAQSLENLDSSIQALNSIFTLANRATQLEKYTTYSLESLNDSLGIKPNYPVGDDGEPTNTAPGGVADIECFYQEYNAICEVTLLKDRSQWFNEGQPVMRHLRDFENQYKDRQSYCLFIAPNIHQDTVNTFWTSVKYEYEGNPQKIIPITINQFVIILNVFREFKVRNMRFRHGYIKNLFDSILNLENINNSREWIDSIPDKLDNRKKSILS